MTGPIQGCQTAGRGQPRPAAQGRGLGRPRGGNVQKAAATAFCTFPPPSFQQEIWVVNTSKRIKQRGGDVQKAEAAAYCTSWKKPRPRPAARFDSLGVSAHKINVNVAQKGTAFFRTSITQLTV